MIYILSAQTENMMVDCAIYARPLNHKY